MFDIKHNFLCNREKIKRKVTFDFFWLTFDFSDLRLIFGTYVWFLIFVQQGKSQTFKVKTSNQGTVTIHNYKCMFIGRSAVAFVIFS